MDKNLLLCAAPLQGYTEAIWRRSHAEVYGGKLCYFTPFVRIEKGQVRMRDLRDVTSQLNEGVDVVPQIIFKDIDEFRLLVSAITSEGFKAVDLNLGCPFPPQWKKGRGAAMIKDISTMIEVGAEITKHHDISFSIKMRLGVEDSQQWQEVMPLINEMPLNHVTIHPRTAIQQYAGDLYFEEVGKILELCRHKVVFNGDIMTPSHIDEIFTKFPQIAGVMIGRGLLGRPSLYNEWLEGKEWSISQQIKHILMLHQKIYDYYDSVLCGQAQFLTKIKSFWEYLEPVIGRKIWKGIKKSSNLETYKVVVATMAQRM